MDLMKNRVHTMPPAELAALMFAYNGLASSAKELRDGVTVKDFPVGGQNTVIEHEDHPSTEGPEGLINHETHTEYTQGGPSLKDMGPVRDNERMAADDILGQTGAGVKYKDEPDYQVRHHTGELVLDAASSYQIITPQEITQP